jgi:hypothetical protein
VTLSDGEDLFVHTNAKRRSDLGVVNDERALQKRKPGSVKVHEQHLSHFTKKSMKPLNFAIFMKLKLGSHAATSIAFYQHKRVRTQRLKHYSRDQKSTKVFLDKLESKFAKPNSRTVIA